MVGERRSLGEVPAIGTGPPTGQRGRPPGAAPARTAGVTVAISPFSVNTYYLLAVPFKLVGAALTL